MSNANDNLPSKTRAYEITTGIISKDQILHEISLMPDLFRSLGKEILLVSYGWGTDLPVDELWKEVEVARADLRLYIQASLEKRAVQTW
jgi:hypothetical protein